MPPIPQFPVFDPLSLEHKDELKAVLGRMGPKISEESFANLYLFRNAHGYRVSTLDGFVFILAKTYAGDDYAFPPWGEGNLPAATRLLADHLTSIGQKPVIFPLDEGMAQSFASDPAWKLTPDRDQADYVYLAQNLAELPGSKYQKKRNRLSKFARELALPWEYAEMTAAHIDGCVSIARGWCEERCSIERPSTYKETESAVEALEMKEELGLRGGVILIDGVVAAYCLGEELNAETFVVHFEKAMPGRDGLAQAINNEFCKHSLSGYKYVNREQDLGDPGLRMAKEGYFPEFLAQKYRLTPR